MIYKYDIMIKGCEFANIYLKLRLVLLLHLVGLFLKNDSYIEFTMIRCYVIQYKNSYELHHVFCIAVTNQLNLFILIVSISVVMSN